MRSTGNRVLVVLAAVVVGLAVVPAASGTAAPNPEPAPGTQEAALAASAWAAVPPRDERRTVPEDRYALAGGCYLVRSVATDAYVARSEDGYAARATAAEAEPFRFPATDLGSYLLADREGQVVAADPGVLGTAAGEVADSSPGAAVEGLSRGHSREVTDALVDSELGAATGRGGAVVAADEPDPLADWQLEELGDDAYRLQLPAVGAALRVAGDGHLTLGDPDGELGTDRFAFELADDCSSWPDIEVNVDGPVARGETPWGQVRGYLDAHLHGMAFEFLGGRARCGKPWSRYGVADALQGCREHELLGGRTHVLETFLSGRDPVQGHDTTGWPTFAEWPEHWSLTYEQTYHRWLERAWRGGLRLYVNLLVDNNKLCDVYPFKHNSCNEMDGVRLQAQRLREFERYVDAQHGGPGRGWLRIVTDPFEARRVMNEGKLAVVMGIEVSVLFDCSLTREQPTCDTAQIDEQLAEVHDLGVRQLELVNKFDNALSGVAGDAGPTGILVNSANLLETGSFWRMGACDDQADHAHDRTHPNIPDDAGLPEELTARDALAGMILDEVGSSGLAPVYGAGPHCNQMGLTALGAHVLHRVMERGMIFDPDHMSARGRAQALDLLEDHGYSGVVSSHSWADDHIYERVLRLGGVVTPMAGNSAGFVRTWLDHRDWVDERFFFGFGYGSDVNGFATQGGPRGGDGPGVTYPFEALGGALVDRQVSGERVFDINTDGVAHYGLYPDWIEDLRVQAGDAIVDDLTRGAEAYLQMWERALGIAPDSCRPDVPALTSAEVGRIERGMTPEEVLLAVGQPRTREGDRFRYCVDRERTATVTFDADGRVRGVQVRRTPHDQVPALVPPPLDEATATAIAARAEAAEARSPLQAHVHGDEPHPHPAPAPSTREAASPHDHEHDHHGDDPAHPAADGSAHAAAPAGAGTAPARDGPIAVAVALLGLTLATIRSLGQRKQAPSPR